MLGNILLMASQVGTLFLMMGVGFLLARWGKLTQAGRGQMVFLLMNIVCPCIMVDTLQIDRDPALIRVMGLGLLIQAALYAVYALLMPLCFRRQGPDTRAALRFGAMYGNVGFMGLPLIQAVLGDAGMVFAVISLAAFNLVGWSHGVVLMGGRGQFSVRHMLLNPGILGSVAALALFVLDIRLPAVAGDAVSFLGSMNTPLAMVVIGAQMAQANLSATFRSLRLYLAAVIKLAAMPALTALLLFPLKLDPMMYTTFVILAGTPCAGFTAIFSQQFHRDAVSGAQLVTLSTLLSILTLPCVTAVSIVLTGA